MLANLFSSVQVNPCTHKDHVTLCTTLDFLHHTFRSLHRSCTGAARLHISESLYSDIIDVCNEAYSAVLPSMAAYFAEHFAQANTFFVSLTGIRETDKEHAAAAHAVCTAYFRLLHTLSSFSDPRLQLGVVLSGHYVTALLVHMAGSEMHSAYDRSVALSILENLLRNHVGGWEAVCCVENPETAVLGGNFHILVDVLLYHTIALRQKWTGFCFRNALTVLCDLHCLTCLFFIIHRSQVTIRSLRRSRSSRASPRSATPPLPTFHLVQTLT